MFLLWFLGVFKNLQEALMRNLCSKFIQLIYVMREI